MPRFLPILSACLLLWAALAAPSTGLAVSQTFSVPVDCDQPGCAIQNYYDHDPTSGWMDFACGGLSYDGHTGTDFRVTKAEMDRGAPVYAAADGVVVGTRDGEAEGLPLSAVVGREAGNGVGIDHGDGWFTQYSHLKRDSIAVKQGQRVKRGQYLGKIGLSGRTEFPHVEFTVRYKGQTVGPFVGLNERGASQQCGVGTDHLWTPAALTKLAYPGAGLVDHGFSGVTPDMNRTYGWAESTIPVEPTSPVLVYWSALYGVRAGDRLTMRILSPEGSVFSENSRTLSKTQAQFRSFIGKRLGSGAWPTGTWTAHTTLTREGTVLVDQRTTWRME